MGVHRRPEGGLPEAIQAGFRLAATSQKKSGGPTRANRPRRTPLPDVFSEAGVARSRGAGLVVVLAARPRFFERQLRVATDVDRQVVLVGHAVVAPHRAGPFDPAEHAFELFTRNAHGYEGFSTAAPRSPQVVGVVAADGLRQAVPRAEEVYGPGLAVVAGEHAGLGTLLRREPVVDAGDGVGHALPAEPV